jgi:copper homeostasis protein
MKESTGMQVTCHRAIDQVRDIFAAIDTLAGIGVKRILTTGQQETPYDGIQVLTKMVTYAQKRIMIMAAGVTPVDVREIVQQTGVDEVHAAANTWRTSKMQYIKDTAKMGHGDDFSLNVVDGHIVKAIKENLQKL